MIKTYQGIEPKIDETAFIAETVDVIGKVTIGKNSNIWYNSVLRADSNTITIGENTSIQDGSVVHVAEEFPTIIGNNVTVGHKALIHGCTIGDNSLIGMGSIVLDNAKLGEYTMVGAGSLVTGKEFPPGVLLLGSPAKVIRELTDKEKESLEKSAEHYVEISKKHK